MVMSRTQRDRQGWPCIGLEEQESVRKQILVSRSFGLRVEAHSEVQQAAATLCRPCLSKAPQTGPSGHWRVAVRPNRPVLA